VYLTMIYEHGTSDDVERDERNTSYVTQSLVFSRKNAIGRLLEVKKDIRGNLNAPDRKDSRVSRLQLPFRSRIGASDRISDDLLSLALLETFS